MTTLAQRHELARAMDFLVAHHTRIRYQEIRPMRLHPTFPQLEAAVVAGNEVMDCSWSVTQLCRVAGLKDPNGLGYDGAGNTQTMYDHLTHYLNPAGAGIGALCFFGVPGELGTQHVTMVRHPGKDPVLFTHGHQGDPSYRLLSWMRSGFQGQPVFLNISRL